ncbi:hemolysin type calcium-binding protein [Rhodobacter viridis]|uniref:Hemolysin type calcium-binding protein n=1 Tax=Rhodobacter viridis TaxID=1054202 RepID=A0A318TYV2_9RHOB|nr:FG-GAP repeat protein [Rhodobacter viridis]PYF10332.1 hemolysin type calcium-binding protein [Rhodobacter viridis]
MTRDVDLSALTSDQGFILHDNVAGAGFGNCVASAGDLNGDGRDDLMIGAPGENTVWVVFGQSAPVPSALDLDRLTADQGFSIVGAADGSCLGASLAAAGDVNGDGFDDILIGAPRSDSGAEDSGAVWVVFGGAQIGADGPLDLSTSGAAAALQISGRAEADLAGASVAAAGDVDGDGLDDLLIGVPRADGRGSDAGAVWLIRGASDLSQLGTLALASLPPACGAAITGLSASDLLGLSVTGVGDLNHDGFDDLLLGAPGRDGAGEDAGAAWVIFGSDDPERDPIDLAHLDPTTGFALTGPSEGAAAGWSVAGLGDINGDGIDDLALGAPEAQGTAAWSGAVWVIYGRDTAQGALPFDTIDLTTLAPEAGFALLGAAPNADLGWAVGSAGDVNGDGIGDIVIGAPGLGPDSESRSGGAYVIFGRNVAAGADPFGTLDLGALAALDGLELTGCGAGASLGVSVAAAGDLNGDGLDDLILGAPGLASDPTAQGAAVVIYGGSFASRLSGSLGNDTLSGSTGGDALLGFSGNDALFGRAGADEIQGAAGDDTLDGGAGIDSLRGGAGDDTYLVSDSAEIVCEFCTPDSRDDAGGLDTVLARVSYDLTFCPGACFVENLTLIGAAPISGTGNALANQLIGNANDNALRGLSGNDTLTGRDGADRLEGGAGADLLDGGAGADTMLGGRGNDTYVVERTTDRVIETASGGTDLVRASVSVDLDATAGAHFVENLTLTGSGNTAGSGNALANQITGTAGNNRLSGGLGLDQLRGGAGADSFVFDTAPAPDNVDRILDFTPEDDTIRLDHAIFTALDPGRLSARAFVVNTTGLAADADDRLIYESDSGRLFYDANGAAAGARVLVARLAADLDLTAADFIIF